ncbi:MAG: DUF4397 domain-containing protein [Gammaproteobacteria bacterium]|jgi:hypothetical protein
MRKFLARIALLGLVAGLASCGGGDGPTYTWLRTLHAVPDAPSLRASFADFVFRETIPFGTVTAEGGESLLKQTGDSTVMTLDYVSFDGTIGGTLQELDVPVAADSISTVIMTGSFEAIEPIVVVTPRRDRPLDRLYFQFAHASPDQPAVDVFVTEPDTDLASTAPVASIEPLTSSDSLEVPFGATRVRLTLAGTLDVVFDSGELDFAESELPTGPGAEWLFAVAPSVVSGPSPVFLIGSSGRSSVAIFDADTTPVIRAIHAATAVDLADFEVLTEPAQVLVAGLGFGQRSALVATPEGEVVFGFRAVAAPEEPVATAIGNPVRGAEFLAALIDSDTGGAVLLEPSRTRSIVTEARLRLAHLAPAGDLASVHLTATEDEPPSAENRVLLNFPPGVLSTHFAVEPGQYFLSITTRPIDDPGNEDFPILAGPVPIDLSGGAVSTLAIFPSLVEGEPDTLQIFDDRLP